MLARAAALSIASALLAAAGASAAGGVLRVSPGLPVVGEQVTIVLELPNASAPSALAVELVSPTGFLMKLPLERGGRHLWRATYHFADEGSWKLRVRVRGVTASAGVLVLQPGAIFPAPRPLLVPGLGGGGGVLLPGLG